MIQALEGLSGVMKVAASFPEKKAVVTYMEASVTPEQMCQALFKAGYGANPKGDEIATHEVSLGDSGDAEDAPIKDLICYCFEYTRDDIERDYVKNGRSLLMEKIAAEKKVGGCDCVSKNPKRR